MAGEGSDNAARRAAGESEAAPSQGYGAPHAIYSDDQRKVQHPPRQPQSAAKDPYDGPGFVAAYASRPTMDLEVMAGAASQAHYPPHQLQHAVPAKQAARVMDGPGFIPAYPGRPTMDLDAQEAAQVDAPAQVGEPAGTIRLHAQNAPRAGEYSDRYPQGGLHDVAYAVDAGKSSGQPGKGVVGGGESVETRLGSVLEWLDSTQRQVDRTPLTGTQHHNTFHSTLRQIPQAHSQNSVPARIPERKMQTLLFFSPRRAARRFKAIGLKAMRKRHICSLQAADPLHFGRCKPVECSGGTVFGHALAFDESTCCLLQCCVAIGDCLEHYVIA